MTWSFVSSVEAIMNRFCRGCTLAAFVQLKALLF